MVTIRLFTHSPVTTNMWSITTLLNMNYSNQNVYPKAPEMASLGLTIEGFSLVGLRSITLRTLP